MGASRIPDDTPPFLTKAVIDGWILMAEARLKDELHRQELAVQHQQHEFDKGQLHLIRKVEKLAGDGENDVGSVGRLEKLVTEYIRENREASTRASQERQQLKETVSGMVSRIDALEDAGRSAKRVEAQVMRWKLIPGFTQNAWKIIAAIVALTLALSGIWSSFHPQTVMLSPQQMQEIRKGPSGK